MSLNEDKQPQNGGNCPQTRKNCPKKEEEPPDTTVSPPKGHVPPTLARASPPEWEWLPKQCPPLVSPPGVTHLQSPHGVTLGLGGGHRRLHLQGGAPVGARGSGGHPQPLGGSAGPGGGLGWGHRGPPYLGEEGGAAGAGGGAVGPGSAGGSGGNGELGEGRGSQSLPSALVGTPRPPQTARGTPRPPQTHPSSADPSNPTGSQSPLWVPPTSSERPPNLGDPRLPQCPPSAPPLPPPVLQGLQHGPPPSEQPQGHLGCLVLRRLLAGTLPWGTAGSGDTQGTPRGPLPTSHLPLDPPAAPRVWGSQSFPLRDPVPKHPGGQREGPQPGDRDLGSPRCS